MSKNYEYTTTKAFKGSLGEGVKLNLVAPDSLAECVSKEFGNGTPYFPDENAVVSKAVAQLNISRIHRAAAWAEKENEQRAKDGKPPVTAAEVEAKAAEFRYGEIRTRSGDGTKPTTKELKAKAAEADSMKSNIIEAIRAGKFNKAMVRNMLEHEVIKQSDLDAAGIALG